MELFRLRISFAIFLCLLTYPCSARYSSLEVPVDTPAVAVPADSIPRDGGTSSASGNLIRLTPLHIIVMTGADLRDQAEAPFTMSWDNATKVFLAAGITGGLLLLDDRIDEAVHSLRGRNPFIKNSTESVTELGGRYGLIGSAAFAGYSLIWNDHKAQETSLLLGQAILTSGIWARAGKLIFGRERPSYSHEHDQSAGGHWSGMAGRMSDRFNNPARYDAFPSGHATTVFAIATVFANQYDDIAGIPEISYGIATLVGISRIINRTHWASDVFVGGCLGYLCAKQVIDTYRAGYLPIAGLSVNIGIDYYRDAPLLSMSVRY